MSNMGSHNAQAKPDAQMGRADPRWSRTAKRTVKKIAAKKRRQRDHQEDS